MKPGTRGRGKGPVPILYLPGDSFFHRLHPFVKFTFVLIASTCVLLLQSMLLLGCVVLVLGVIVVVNKLSLGASLRYFKWVLLLAVSLVPLDMLFNPVVLPGQEVLVTLLPPFLPVRRLTLYVAARSFGWVACFSITNALLVFTTRPRDFVVGLMEARFPQGLAFGISIALRYVPLIQHDMNEIAVAQRVRGRSRATVRGVKDVLAYFKEQVTTGLVAVFRHAFHTSVSMEKRAFRLHPTRTLTYTIGFRARDAAFLAATVIAFTMLLLYGFQVLPLPPVPALLSLLRLPW